ncbi:hypothetical protein ACT29H_10535 [Thermophagus sp. OGC60D27]|uniref:hypothetical protein n=1 Tax=Thermophagus sp. OGC60D27 TaxID=3458415 RepID=UPI004037FA2A
MNKIKALLLSLFVFGQAFFLSGAAQKNEEEARKDRLKSQKVAYLTEKIGLSAEKAQQFWPLYNEMSEKMDKLWDQKKKLVNRLYHPKEKLSESEKEAVLDQFVDYHYKKSILQKEYHEKFKKILTIDQIIKLYGAEYEFKKNMLHLLREGKPTSCTESEKGIGVKVSDPV